MKQNNGKIWFEAGIDTSQLARGVTAINRDFDSVQNSASQTGNVITDMWKSAAVAAGAYLTATQAMQLGSQIIDLTAQRQLMEKSFEVLFGGVEQAKQKIDEITQYAILSPYEFADAAKGVQTMSAFGVEADKIMPTLKMLGDVAAGNKQRFESLSLVFAQTTSAGRLMGQDLLQFINAGWNPLQTIAEQTGKSVAQLKKEMENGAISSQMVGDALTYATSEGGKFYSMTQKMADSIEAASSTFRSAWVEKQIEWGKSNEEIIKQFYNLGTTVVQNADSIAKAVGVLVTAVGTYKASLIIMNTAQRVNMLIMRQAVAEKKLAAAANITLSNSEAIAAAKTKLLSVAQMGLAKALNVVKLAITSNPIGLLVTLLSSAAAAMLLFRKRTEDVTDAMAKEASESDKQVARIKSLQAIVNDANGSYDDRTKALKELQNIVPSYTASLTKEGELIRDNTSAIDDYIVALERKTQLKAVREKLEAKFLARQQEIERYQKATEDLRATPTQQTADNAQFAAFVQNQITIAEDLHNATMAIIDADIEALKSNYTKISDSADSASGKVIATINQQIKTTQSNITRLQTQIEGLRSGKLSFIDEKGEVQAVDNVIEAISQLESELTASQKNLEILTGKKAKVDLKVDLKAEEGSIADLQAQIKEKRTTLDLQVLTPEKRLEILQQIADLETQIALIDVKLPIAVEIEPIDTDALLKEFATYDQQLLALKADFERKKAAMFEDGGLVLKAEFEQGNLDNLVAQYDKAVTDINVKAAKSTSLLQSLFEDASNKSTASILNIVDASNRLVDALSQIDAQYTAQIGAEFKLTEDQFKALIPLVPQLRDRISKLSDTAQGLTSNFRTLGDALDLIKDGFSTDNTDMFIDGLNVLNGKVNDSLTLFKGFTSILGDIGELSGNDIFSDIADDLNQVVGVLEETMSMATTGAQLGGPIGAIVGGAIGLASSLFSIASEAEKRQKEALSRIREAQLQIEKDQLAHLRELALAGKDLETIFGVDSYAKAINSAKVYGDETVKLKKQLDELGNAQIKTGFKKTGLFGWGKGKDIYSDLLSVYPDLIDAQGDFNIELAKSILATDQLDAASKKQLEQAIDTAEQVKAAYQQMEDYFTSIMGGIGSTISNTIADGFRNGKDVGMQVIDDLSKGLEQFAQDMAYSLAFGDLMKKASDDMMAIAKDTTLTEEERLQELAKIFGETAKDSKEATDKMNEYLKQFKEQAEKEGVQIFKPDKDVTTQGQAKAGATTTIQETTAVSIEGKLTALQISVGQSVTYLSMLQVATYNIRDSIDIMNLRVKSIADNVKLMAGYTQVLPSMAKDIKMIVNNTKNL